MNAFNRPALRQTRNAVGALTLIALGWSGLALAQVAPSPATAPAAAVAAMRGSPVPTLAEMMAAVDWRSVELAPNMAPIAVAAYDLDN